MFCFTQSQKKREEEAMLHFAKGRRQEAGVIMDNVEAGSKPKHWVGAREISLVLRQVHKANPIPMHPARGSSS
jgi:phage-related protein